MVTDNIMGGHTRESNAQRGWGRGAKRAVSNWYMSKDERELAMQVVKYPQRDGWSHRDLLRLCHIQSDYQGGKHSELRNSIYKFIVDGWEDVGSDPHPVDELALIWAAERAKKDISEEVLLKLIADYRLPMEVIPSEKQTKAVYEALIPHAGITWLIRNLGNLSNRGVIATGQYSNLSTVTERITNIELLKKGRVHPLFILTALNTYKGGKGIRGGSEWPVVQDVVDALDSAFYLAFDAIEPTHQRYVLGIDVSGSMTTGCIAGMPGITPNIGASAMAMVTKRSEPYCAIMGFSRSFVDLGISKTDRLDTVMRKTQLSSFGSTNCAAPFQWALENKVEADTFVVYTDSDTNHFHADHAVVALRKYREKMGIPARLVVVGMNSGPFTVADPSDAGMLDIVGFNSAAPAVIAEFSKGNI